MPSQSGRPKACRCTCVYVCTYISIRKYILYIHIYIHAHSRCRVKALKGSRDHHPTPTLGDLIRQRMLFPTLPAPRAAIRAPPAGNACTSCRRAREDERNSSAQEQEPRCQPPFPYYSLLIDARHNVGGRGGWGEGGCSVEPVKLRLKSHGL